MEFAAYPELVYAGLCETTSVSVYYTNTNY